MTPQLIVEQKISAFANKYKIHTVSPDGAKGPLCAFAQQKRLAFKEKVTFYTDESKNQVSFTFRAEKVMDFHGRFLVEDANGQVIGMFRKDFKQSLISSTWHIIDPQENRLATFTESNTTLALIRRFGGEIPLVGIFVDLIVMLLKYHFVLLDPAQRPIGKYQKTTLFRDHYQLLSDQSLFNTYDWRVIASVAVAMDALQGR